MIAFGGYTLNIGETKKGFCAPFIAIRKKRGSLYMIAVALIYSVTATLGKLAIQHSSPPFFGIFYYSTIAIAMTPLALFKSRKEMRVWPHEGAIRVSVLPGFCHAINLCPYDCHQPHPGSVHDLSETPKSPYGRSVWLYTFQRNQYQGEICRYPPHDHRLCHDYSVSVISLKCRID